MYLKEFLEKLGSKKIKLYVDMDGVIADYDVGKPKQYDIKRPLKTSISKLEEISKMPNVELFILSVSRMNEGIAEKNKWLDSNASFFKKENRNIIPREANGFKTAVELKVEFIKNIKINDDIIVVIDDDPLILHSMREKCKDIILLKDTVLVD